MNLNISGKNTNFDYDLSRFLQRCHKYCFPIFLSLSLSDTRRPGRFIELHILSAVRSRLGL